METTIYYADVKTLEDEKIFKKYYEQMPLYRKEKIDRLRFSKDKRLSLGVGVLLQIACQKQGIIQPSEIQKNENGKPYFEEYPDFYFNLSHSEDKVLCMVSDKPVGCDIECHKKDCLHIANRYFFKGEYERIMQQSSEEEKQKMFYRFWTLKESFMKVTGKGFSLPLNEFEIVLEEPITVKQSISQNSYSFFEYDVNDKFSCSCCVESVMTTKPKFDIITIK